MLGKFVVYPHNYTTHMNPTLMNVLHYEDSNAIEIRNGIKFDYNPGLSHMSTQRTISALLRS